MCFYRAKVRLIVTENNANNKSKTLSTFIFLNFCYILPIRAKALSEKEHDLLGEGGMKIYLKNDTVDCR